jgi:hypothetical protein
MISAIRSAPEVVDTLGGDVGPLSAGKLNHASLTWRPTNSTFALGLPIELPSNSATTREMRESARGARIDFFEQANA